MCGIAGFSDFKQNYYRSPGFWSSILKNMNQTQKHRGPDGEGIYLDDHAGLAHVRLSIIDLKTGQQPMTRRLGDRSCTITYNGEIYNMADLKQELSKKGVFFRTTSDTEVLLAGYMEEGIDFLKRVNGIFAAAIWDDTAQALYLFRDRLGVKPLFYAMVDDTLIFSSEIKGLFAYPGLTPRISKEGLCEILALGPAHTQGKGVFEEVHEALAGSYLRYDRRGLCQLPYWSLESHPHEDSCEETIEKTSWLIHDAVKKQMLSDIPISTFLSGGVDSSLITAICAKELSLSGKQLNTFSFDFKDNSKYFSSNSFQPSQDRPYVDQMLNVLDTSHHYLECDNDDMIAALYDAVDARDLPCMADVESSLLYFCRQVTAYNKVTLTGECADEIFGGYPWFHRKDMLGSHSFPWSRDMAPRTALLSQDFITALPLEEYAQNAYETSLAQMPRLPGESPEEARRREIGWLNLKWFMMTLLDRMDRTSMHTGLEARVPFADHRIVEYVWNVPWEYKCTGNMVKGLLRQAGVSHLPSEVLWRKKSPYPKTYHPEYEQLLGKRLLEVVESPNAPIRPLVDVKKIRAFVNAPSDYGKPWYGQLMAGPQMLAYLLQINYWLEHYNIDIL